MGRFRKRDPFDLRNALSSKCDIALNDWVSGYCALARQANIRGAFEHQFQNTVGRYVRRKHTLGVLPSDAARSLLFKRWRADGGDSAFLARLGISEHAFVNVSLADSVITVRDEISVELWSDDPVRCRQLLEAAYAEIRLLRSLLENKMHTKQ